MKIWTSHGDLRFRFKILVFINKFATCEWVETVFIHSMFSFVRYWSKSKERRIKSRIIEIRKNPKMKGVWVGKNTKQYAEYKFSKTYKILCSMKLLWDTSDGAINIWVEISRSRNLYKARRAKLRENLWNFQETPPRLHLTPQEAGSRQMKLLHKYGLLNSFVFLLHLIIKYSLIPCSCRTSLYNWWSDKNVGFILLINFGQQSRKEILPMLNFTLWSNKHFVSWVLWKLFWYLIVVRCV